MNISEEGLSLIKSSEAENGIPSLDAYQDEGYGVWTIGFGHIRGVKQGDICTPEQAEQWLAEDLIAVEKCIVNTVRGTLTQGQYDALCSFVFNLGCSALRNSMLLRLLNEGDDAGAAEQFARWNHSGGKVDPILIARRKKETEMFLA
jgi:lysozyme